MARQARRADYRWTLEMRQLLRSRVSNHPSACPCSIHSEQRTTHRNSGYLELFVAAAWFRIRYFRGHY